jgi:hypothetical protein
MVKQCLRQSLRVCRLLDGNRRAGLTAAAPDDQLDRHGVAGWRSRGDACVDLQQAGESGGAAREGDIVRCAAKAGGFVRPSPVAYSTTTSPRRAGLLAELIEPS